MTTQAEIETLARRMYREIRERMDDPTFGPAVPSKITALYGPPMVRPDVALISFQGGGGDRSPTRWTWPERLVYLDDCYCFGRRLRKQFRCAEMWETLEQRTVAMAACFPEAPGSDAGKWLAKTGPKADWRRFSVAWVRRLVRAMRPRTVLVFGKKASESLGMESCWRDIEYRGGVGQQQVYARATVEGSPAVYCGHLSWRELCDKEVQRCLGEVKRLLNEVQQPP